jgi:hypothetical protein
MEKLVVKTPQGIQLHFVVSVGFVAGFFFYYGNFPISSLMMPRIQ